MQKLLSADILLTAEVARMEDMFDVFDKLMTKNIIDFGKYDKVKALMSYSTDLMTKCSMAIEQFEEKMKLTTRHDIPGKYKSLDYFI